MVPARISSEIGQLFQADPGNRIYGGQGYSQGYGEVTHGKQTGEVTGQTLLPWLAIPSAVLVTNDLILNIIKPILYT